MPKAPAGTVHIECFRDRLRLRLTYNYRKFYYTRSTYISHALTAGVSPLELSEQTGHDIRTMLRNYAACIKKTDIPEYF